MAAVIAKVPKSRIERIKGDFMVRESLIGSIISQQLSTKVARVIHQRFLDFYQGEFPDNKTIINSSIEDLRSIGLSYQKSNYIKNIASFFHENKLKNEDFVLMNDEEIITRLTEIKGVGKWTVEMVLIFSLARENIFSVDDYGIMSAMVDIYKIKEEGKARKDKLKKIASKWQPYCSLACLYLWAYRDL